MPLILDPSAVVPLMPDPAPDWLTDSVAQDPDMLRFYAGAGLAMLILERLRARDLIAFGPRSPLRGGARSFVTTEGFLQLFGLDNLQDLPELPAPTAAMPRDMDVPWSIMDDEG